MLTPVCGPRNLGDISWQLCQSGAEQQQEPDPEVRVHLQEGVVYPNAKSSQLSQHEQIMQVYDLSQDKSAYRLDREMLDKMIHAALTTPIKLPEGQVLSICDQRLLLVGAKDRTLNIYRFSQAKQVDNGTTSTIYQLFSLNKGNWAEAFKAPNGQKNTVQYRKNLGRIEHGLTIVGIVNPPELCIRGCVKRPFHVREITTLGLVETHGTLMRAYHSNAKKALDPNGIVDKRRKEPNSEPFFVDIAHQALSVLARLEEAGVSHRDIKPENVLVSLCRDGFVDFHLSDWDTAHTKDERLGGMRTFMYLIPDEIGLANDAEKRGDFAGQMEIEQQMDILAMGITLYTVITGEFPFKFSQCCGYDCPDVGLLSTTQIDKLPEDLCEIIPKMLDSKPSQRGSGRQLLAELNQKLAQRPTTGVWSSVRQRAAGVVHDEAR